MRKVLMFTALLVNITLLVLACDDKKVSTVNEFYYYPDKNVYYDLGKQKFLYSTDGAKTWQSFTGSNDADVVTLGDKVLINSSDTAVYNENANHRKLYAGKLYNLNVSTITVDNTAPNAVTERVMTVKKKPAVKAKNEEKSKKGINKFFDKIFGKSK